MTLESVFSSKYKPKFQRYEEYWSSITPSNDSDVFRRWLFAYTSIHTTWESNVRAYNLIKNFEQWKDDKEELYNLLLVSRAGCHNLKTESIWAFKDKFWNDPQKFKKSSDESWSSFRNRLAHDLKGIGLAKTSFALEMCYPNNADIVCFDVHMLRAMNLPTRGFKSDSKKDISDYMNAEATLVDKSRNMNLSPYIVRCVYWDILQGQENSRYWSYCLESQLCLEI